MTDLFDNPIGLDGFEFVEFSAPEKGLLEPVFEAMGFTQVARHRSKDVELWRQGEINLITNYEPRSPAWFFSREHGPAACGMAFRVRNARTAYAELLARGAEPVQVETGPMELRIPAIRGIGGSIIYLVDRYEADGDGALSIYDIDFDYLPDADRHPAGAGLLRIDHLTHNVYGGRMAHWADYYQTLFNFREIRYFDIKGEYTGLTSQALTAPDGKIRIPLNEEGDGGKKGQIEEFLRQFNGEGIQHIALICDDLVHTWDRLKQAGVPLMSAPPETYYEMLEGRLPDHGQPVAALQSRGILLDGSTEGGSRRLLLQIFAEPTIGPVFFEFIERQGDEGFGEGNFKALFESLERDQLKRGVLKVDEPAG
jgi:4-hydroxyphenylpyruvate dioxygenase